MHDMSFLRRENVWITSFPLSSNWTGLPLYNVRINPEKTKLSFPLPLPDGQEAAPRTVRVENGAEFVQWCGLLINVDTLEVQADYTRRAGQEWGHFCCWCRRWPSAPLALGRLFCATRKRRLP